MRYPGILAVKTLIPMFAKGSSHPAAPLGRRTVGARSEGQGRFFAGASRAPLTAASTLAGWRHSGDKAVFQYAAFLLAGVLSLGSGSGMALAQPTATIRPAAVNLHAAHIAEASHRFGIPEHWIVAVLRAESAGDVRAASSAGAMGLMQVMPDTWSELRERHGLGRDPFDPRQNVLAGTAYLREMWDRYGNVTAMLAAYNAGPGRYDEYLATGRVLPAETRAYVAALVPILGDPTASEPPITEPSAPPDWREAPLFASQPDGTGAAVATGSDVQTGGLFVAVSQQDRP